MKLVTKYLICYETAPSGSWSQFLTMKNEFNTEEEAIEVLEMNILEIKNDSTRTS